MSSANGKQTRDWQWHCHASSATLLLNLKVSRRTMSDADDTRAHIRQRRGCAPSATLPLIRTVSSRPVSNAARPRHTMGSNKWEATLSYGHHPVCFCCDDDSENMHHVWNPAETWCSVIKHRRLTLNGLSLTAHRTHWPFTMQKVADVLLAAAHSSSCNLGSPCKLTS